jgi:hypothetical protein
MRGRCAWLFFLFLLYHFKSSFNGEDEHAHIGRRAVRSLKWLGRSAPATPGKLSVLSRSDWYCTNTTKCPAWPLRDIFRSSVHLFIVVWGAWHPLPSVHSHCPPRSHVQVAKLATGPPLLTNIGKRCCHPWTFEAGEGSAMG